MTYLIVKDKKIENIIEADAAFAEEVGALPNYDGAAIEAQYSPPVKPTIDLLTARIEALTDRNAFLEDCVAEMAAKVYV